MEVFGLVLFASIRYSPFAIRQKNKAGGTPADAIRNTSAPYGCGARPAGRAAPTGVPPRFSWQRTNAATQLQTRFLGPDFGGRYSASIYPSPAIQSQAGRNAGRAFSLKPPGSGGDEPLPAGTAL